MLHLGHSLHDELLEPLHKDTLVLALLQFKLLRLNVLGLSGEQVEDVLVVNFEVTAADEILLVSLVLVDTAEDVGEGVGDDAAQYRVIGHAHHSVRLAAPGLAVRKNSSIVALQDRFDKWKCTLVVDILLLGIRIIHAVKSKAMRNFAFPWDPVVNADTVSLRVYFSAPITAYTRMKTDVSLIIVALPLSISLLFIGRTRTITFTVSELFLDIVENN